MIGSPTRQDLQDLVLALGADVEPQVLDLRHLLPLLLVEQVDRLAGDDAQHRALRAPDGQPLADEDLRVPAADGRDVDEAVVVDVLHDQADLVAVPGQHDPQRGCRRSATAITLPWTSVRISSAKRGGVIAHQPLGRGFHSPKGWALPGFA